MRLVIYSFDNQVLYVSDNMVDYIILFFLNDILKILKIYFFVCSFPLYFFEVKLGNPQKKKTTNIA